jgi:hypothetical protein
LTQTGKWFILWQETSKGKEMWQEEYSEETNFSTEKIWSLWADVQNWNKWNTGIEYSNLNGNFENGTYGSFKTSNGVKTIFLFFELRNCIKNKSFIAKIKLLFCIIDFGYELIEENNKLKIKHYIKIYGPLTFYYKKTIGYSSTKYLQSSVKRLMNLAEKMK